MRRLRGVVLLAVAVLSISGCETLTAEQGWNGNDFAMEDMQRAAAMNATQQAIVQNNLVTSSVLRIQEQAAMLQILPPMPPP
jgi:uncharacterized lipoprotein